MHGRCRCAASYNAKNGPAIRLTLGSRPTQVKVADHILTGHKVAIKILNRKKIQAMDMDEKGAHIYIYINYL